MATNEHEYITFNIEKVANYINARRYVPNEIENIL